MEPENKELTILLTFRRKPDGGFSLKFESQGDQERKARMEMKILPSLEEGREVLLQKIGDALISEVLINFTRVFKARETYDPDDYELLCERK